MRRHRAALAILAVMAAGCGDGGPALVPVQGRVTLDGQPLAYKSVFFSPEPGTPGAGAGANTAADGSYTLLAVRPGATRDMKGVPPGSYRVVVTEPVIPIKAAQAEPAQGPEDTVIVPPDSRTRRKSVIPPDYTKPETTRFRVEVPREGGVLDLALSSRP